ncbi:LacI family DNA-binding transcriptional regulator [Allonocardiopsis opalescens]|uniref:LacI family transcriptional regulator n=1 Tax=Allonocardiopsis opalescens TaxID=1144618 RepID=A0A2T0QA11_9ACTN|nr:LacI family DNA-binding transcriptional regulator [Allonocardiopsis opalescens]PRY00631.1 LacI family transcriptional regulator [Allonocardiopsis opalescens]
MSTRRSTLEQVAARAKVSRGTVSRVVNGSARVNPRTRESVLRAIDELGYVPDRAARTLAARRTGVVALVLSEEPGRPFEQPYFGDILRGINSATGAAGIQLMLSFTRSPADRARLAHDLRTQRVDGVMVISLLRQDPLPGLLAGSGVPTVLGGRPLDPAMERGAYVDADNTGGARRATEHLIGQDRRRIATIAGLRGTTVGMDRLAGYRQALAGGPEPVSYGDFSAAGGAAAMRELLEREPSLDAVFVASDNMAVGALRVLERHGRRVPDDVAVIGFEDAAFARHAEPALTTVHQPTGEMGRRMVEMLLSRAHDTSPPDQPVICDTGLVVRASA